MATKKTTEKTTEVKSKVKKTTEKVENISKKIESKVTKPVEQKVVDLPKVKDLSKPIEVPKEIKEVIIQEEVPKVEEKPKVEVPVKNPKAETKQKPAGFEKQPSAGKQIRELFINNLSKLTDKEMEILTSAEKTKEVLKIRYAFLKKSTDNKEDRKVNGNARYGSKTIEINGVEYWLTNDLYERNIEVFKTWVESLK